jgi:hypothetical protein
MVGDAHDAPPPGSVGRLRPLNAPVQVQVRTGRDGAPVRVVMRQRGHAVATVQERWRIDEGWWWERPVSRMYWRLVLDDGRQVTIFQDLFKKTWWVQRS